MTPGMSVFLDLLRFFAAVTVVLGHLCQGPFSTGWPNFAPLAALSVATFFVLSGFVIRYVSLNRDHQLFDFTIARLARIYSVLVPAIVITAAADTVSYYLDHAYYLSNWGDNATWPLLRILACLTFVNEAYGYDISLFSNVPTWSLGYEVPFYFFYAFAVFLHKGRRVVAIGLCMIATGPHLFVLMPPWIAGACLFDVLRKVPPSSRLGALSAVLFGCIAFATFHSRFDLASHIYSFHWLGKSAQFLTYYIWTIATCLLILSIHCLEPHIRGILLQMKKVSTILSSSTFSIYLYHFPLLVLVYSIWHYDRGSTAAKLLVFGSVLISCFVLSRWTEAKKRSWAAGLRWIASQVPAAPVWESVLHGRFWLGSSSLPSNRQG